VKVHGAPLREAYAHELFAGKYLRLDAYLSDVAAQAAQSKIALRTRTTFIISKSANAGKSLCAHTPSRSRSGKKLFGVRRRRRRRRSSLIITRTT